MDENETVMAPTMPGKNRYTGEQQGTLKRGNTVGVGRLKRQFRLKACRGALDNLDLWVKIAAGKKCVPYYESKGIKKLGLRFPTISEMQDARDYLAKFGPGTLDKVEVEDVTPVDRDVVRQRLLDMAREQSGQPG